MARSPILSIIATYSNNLSDIAISDRQLLFVQDTHKIALDLNGKRIFYNQIIELDTESDRLSIDTPVNGEYYFVIGTANLWAYQKDKWIQITASSQNTVYIGTSLPELGAENTFYVNKDEKNISVWDEDINDYIIVGDTTTEITDDEITALFV